MRFSLRHLMFLILVVSVCSAWRFDQQKLCDKIVESEHRNLVHVVDAVRQESDLYPYYLRDHKLADSLPVWADSSAEPEVSVADARKFADEILSKIKQNHSSSGYQNVSLSAMKLYPVTSRNSDPRVGKHWVYKLEFSGLPVEKDPETQPQPELIYQAVVLMDGTIHSSYSAKEIRKKMAVHYPSR